MQERGRDLPVWPFLVAGAVVGWGIEVSRYATDPAHDGTFSSSGIREHTGRHLLIMSIAGTAAGGFVYAILRAVR